MMARKDTDHCASCGSESLFSGWYDEDDYAYPLGMNENPKHVPPGIRWTTFCNDCGAEQ